MKPDRTNLQLFWTPIPIPLPRFKLVTKPAFILVIFHLSTPKEQAIDKLIMEKETSFDTVDLQS